MAENNSQLPDTVNKVIKITAIGSLLLVLSPVLAILSPVLIPVYVLYWIYRYLTGKNPIGSGLVSKARGKIADRAVDVKNKMVQAGENIVDTAEELAKNNIITKTGEKIVDTAADLAKNNVVARTGEKIVDTAEDAVRDGVKVAGGVKDTMENLGKDIWKLGGGSKSSGSS